MRDTLPIRETLVGLVLLANPGLHAQTQQSVPAKPSAAISTLPAVQPTEQVPRADTAPSTPVVAHHIEVKYTDGQLAVLATNASLNEILREVAHQTGMKITGGVADDRVFGSYGPSKPSVVLDALLEGTGSNMLLVDDAQGKSELILTPRHGGATPPSANAPQSNDSDDQDGSGQYVAPVRPFQPPVANGRGPNSIPPGSQITAQDSEPNENEGAKSPQQIYEQLQKAMQQKQAANVPPE